MRDLCVKIGSTLAKCDMSCITHHPASIITGGHSKAISTSADRAWYVSYMTVCAARSTIAKATVHIAVMLMLTIIFKVFCFRSSAGSP